MSYFKTFTLLIVLSALLVAVAYQFGGMSAATVGLAFAFLMNVGAYFWSDKIVLRMYGARTVTEDEAPVLYRVTRRLAEKMGMPMPRVCVCPSESPNAFATGRSPRHAAVCATTGILRLLDEEELEGVMAHELSHVKNRDVLISTVAGVIGAAITYVAHFGLYFGGGRRDERSGNPLLGLVVMLAAGVAATLLRLAISRGRELAADRRGALVTGRPQALARALEKIHHGAARIPMLEGSPATSHLMIAPVLGEEGILTNLFRTHPTLGRRLAALEALREETSRRGNPFLT